MKLFYKRDYFDNQEKNYESLTDTDYKRLQRFFPLFNSGVRVLELGCGSCAFGKRVQADIHDAKLFGIDICFPLLRFSPVPCCQANVCEVPFKDASFDCILVAAAFHHFPDIPQALRVAYRCLRPGGVLITYEPNKYHPQRFVFMTTPLRYLFYRTGDNSISPNWFRRQLEKVGFVKVRLGFIAMGNEKSSKAAHLNVLLADAINRHMPVMKPFVSPWFIAVATKDHD
jgi:ubiquinone/menaquinone biosynthesis C-methylase UbiE